MEQQMIQSRLSEMRTDLEVEGHDSPSLSVDKVPILTHWKVEEIKEKVENWWLWTDESRIMGDVIVNT